MRVRDGVEHPKFSCQRDNATGKDEYNECKYLFTIRTGRVPGIAASNNAT